MIPRVAWVREPEGPRRRTVVRAGGLAVPAALLFGSAASGWALTGCGSLVPGERRTPRVPTADELAVERAVGEAARLRAAALALAGEQRALGPALRRIADDHAEHLAALGSAGATPEPTGSAGDRGEGLPDDAGAFRDAEWSAARVALRDALTAAGDLAVLLARIAAARAVHADLVASGAGSAPPAQLSPAAAPTGTAVATPTPSAGQAGDSGLAAQRTALTRLLAGEHAAVFAYPIVVARCAGSKRAVAESLWQAHVAERDALERLLETAGVEPPAAAPAYDVGPVPADSGAAAELAAKIETGLAGLAAVAVRDATGSARLHVARQLVSAARRSATWGGSPGALPGGTAGSPTPKSS
jgi:hypothetical protein